MIFPASLRLNHESVMVLFIRCLNANHTRVPPHVDCRWS